MRHSLRALLRSPGFALMVVMALGLGIGATTAIFSVLDAVVLRPLPYQKPEQLVMIWETDKAKSLEHEQLSPVNFGDYRALTQVFDDAAAWWRPDITYTRDGSEPLRIETIEVSNNFFSVLGVSPILGGGFVPQQTLFGPREDAVVVSHRFWREHLASDPNAIGKIISLNGEAHQVLGVMPEGFTYPGETDLWQRLQWDLAQHSRFAHFMEGVARLKPGVTRAQAQGELNALTGRLEREFTQSNKDRGARVVALDTEVVGFFRPALFVLFAAVGLLLVIACMNVSNLLLVRAASRRREAALRSALGASRSRIILQFFAESSWLACGGAILGTILAYIGIRLLVLNSPVAIPRMGEIAIDARALGFTLAVATLTTFAFGLVPALSVSHNLEENLKEGGRSAGGGRRSGFMRNALVVGEVALAMMLLFGAGLLIRTVSALLREDPGVRAQESLTASLVVTASAYPNWDRVEHFYSTLVANLRRHPSVLAAGAANRQPLEVASRLAFLIVGLPRPPQGEEPLAQHHTVTEGYFQAMGIPLLNGRDFDERDTVASTPVVMINQALARQYFPKENPVGRIIWSSARNIGPLGSRITKAPEHQIIGVVADVKNQSLRTAAEPAIYYTGRQFPFRSMFVVVRSNSDSAQAATIIREAVRDLDPALPVSNIRTVQRVLQQSVDQPRFLMYLMTGFALLALVLACFGVYGLLSYDVAQQRKEISVRMALGASPGKVLRHVLARGMKLTGLGMIAGVTGAIASGRLMSALLYGVNYTDATTFGVVIGAVAAIAFLACIVPGRAASIVDPVTGLRSE